MEHVVFYTAADGSPAYRRTANLDDAVRVVEHLRNAEGREEVHVYSLATVALNFRPYYRVELNTNPAVPAHEEPQPAALSFTAPVPVQMHAMSAELAAFSVEPVEIAPATTDEVIVVQPLEYNSQLPLGDEPASFVPEPIALEQAMAAAVEAAPVEAAPVEVAPVEAAPVEVAQAAEAVQQLPPPPPPFVEPAPAQASPFVAAAPPPPPAAPAPDPMGAFMPVHPGALPMPPAPEPAPAMAAAGPAEAEDGSDQNGQGRGRSLGFFTR